MSQREGWRELELPSGKLSALGSVVGRKVLGFTRRQMQVAALWFFIHTLDPDTQDRILRRYIEEHNDETGFGDVGNP